MKYDIKIPPEGIIALMRHHLNLEQIARLCSIKDPESGHGDAVELRRLMTEEPWTLGLPKGSTELWVEEWLREHDKAA